MHQLDRANHSLEFKTPCGAFIPNPNETTSMKKYLLISFLLHLSHSALLSARLMLTSGTPRSAFETWARSAPTARPMPSTTAVPWSAGMSRPMAAFISMDSSGRKQRGWSISASPGGGDSDTAEVFCFAINNAGNVVGRARQVDGRQVAFFWSPTDGFTTLWHHSTNSDNGNSAYAINDLDQVTGNLNVNKHGLIYHAFLWSPGMGNPRDLGVVGGAQYSLGNGINNLGKIVGGSYVLGDVWEPMSWTKRSGMNLLGTALRAGAGDQ